MLQRKMWWEGACHRDSAVKAVIPTQNLQRDHSRKRFKLHSRHHTPACQAARWGPSGLQEAGYQEGTAAPRRIRGLPGSRRGSCRVPPQGTTLQVAPGTADPPDPRAFPRRAGRAARRARSHWAGRGEGPSLGNEAAQLAAADRRCPPLAHRAPAEGA